MSETKQQIEFDVNAFDTNAPTGMSYETYVRLRLALDRLKELDAMLSGAPFARCMADRVRANVEAALAA